MIRDMSNVIKEEGSAREHQQTLFLSHTHQVISPVCTALNRGAEKGSKEKRKKRKYNKKASQIHNGTLNFSRFHQESSLQCPEANHHEHVQ